MSKRKFEMPAFLPVMLNDGSTGLVSIGKILEDPELCGQVANKALAELEGWCTRYQDFFRYIKHRPACAVVKLIDKTRREMGSDWPTLPDEILDEE